MVHEVYKLYDINNLVFFQGTCILFSNDIIKFLIDNKEKLLYNIIDDIAIALFMRLYISIAYTKGYLIKYFDFGINDYYCGPVIRNKNNSRETDIINMQNFVNMYLESIK